MHIHDAKKFPFNYVNAKNKTRAVIITLTNTAINSKQETMRESKKKTDTMFIYSSKKPNNIIISRFQEKGNV
jgi:hypothetical protein